MPAYTATSLKAELNSRGWRLTPQRETLLHVFQNLPRGNHLSAEELHDLLEQRGEPISLSTIYRSVKLMARMGILRELELAEGHKHYELNQPFPNHHHHLVCIQCNRTIEFKNDSILKQAIKQVDKEGFQLIDCQLTIHSICPEAVRMGWPSALPSNWCCTRSIAQGHVIAVDS
ncbi:MAG TPA: transcriptional repressor [Cyanobacteria bacterium UBA11149]|nr:transcriptional repressor [Cyanobacteria bacterium UBA11367]HBE60530.1 transcriptional repressor [Cyanobacteria bacterium UBA11366]HBK65068.1 transcriptional repressor [Cyanobacteria bacterium UBA11166]HBR72230.1 transcriptional repressor [Cyanobacteria bacterium UBA11159]HBS72452.1 transcriptional repressor [Cyanobacteria bacterium UBA11153]HBW92426.1 transcriptional repressor [Cyanobacteria bacterium UBA11149]HCA95653.1 transcriptional repressor [Cyanobacteria bacterium UBA9226]